MKCLVVSNLFKGTLTTIQIGKIVKSEFDAMNIQSDYFPISDGGEWFIDCISYIDHIKPFSIEVIGALWQK